MYAFENIIRPLKYSKKTATGELFNSKPKMCSNKRNYYYWHSSREEVEGGAKQLLPKATATHGVKTSVLTIQSDHYETCVIVCAMPPTCSSILPLLLPLFLLPLRPAQRVGELGLTLPDFTDKPGMLNCVRLARAMPRQPHAVGFKHSAPLSFRIAAY